jgi:hypothetical protein
MSCFLWFPPLQQGGQMAANGEEFLPNFLAQEGEGRVSTVAQAD